MCDPKALEIVVVEVAETISGPCLHISCLFILALNIVEYLIEIIV